MLQLFDACIFNIATRFTFKAMTRSKFGKHPWALDLHTTLDGPDHDPYLTTKHRNTPRAWLRVGGIPGSLSTRTDRENEGDASGRRGGDRQCSADRTRCDWAGSYDGSGGPMGMRSRGRGECVFIPTIFSCFLFVSRCSLHTYLNTCAYGLTSTTHLHKYTTHNTHQHNSSPHNASLCPENHSTFGWQSSGIVDRGIELVHLRHCIQAYSIWRRLRQRHHSAANHYRTATLESRLFRLYRVGGFRNRHRQR